MSGFEFDKPKNAGANLHRDVTCKTCGGDRFVVVATRKPQQSVWMRERGIEPRSDLPIEEYAACPSCNTSDTSFWRSDGTPAAALDPAKVRQLMATASPSSSLRTPPAEARVKVDKIIKDMP